MMRIVVITYLVQCGHSVKPSDVNLALDKPANQSGAVSTGHGAHTADLAVDGDYAKESVAIVDASLVNYTDYAWWWVDLEDTYRVRNITIYNADGTGNDALLRYFILSVGPDFTQLKDCGPEYTEEIGRKEHVTIPCNQTGRIVHFRKTGTGEEPNKAPLREVQVYGIIQHSCQECPSGTPCDADTGCSQCAPGKVQSPECDKDCSFGTYGLDCSHQCGQCAQLEDCSIVDGVCSSGCQIWWVDERCDREIVIPNRTDETVALGEPTNSSMKVTWQQIQSLDMDLYDHYGYAVLYKNTTSTSYSEWSYVQHTGTDDLTVTLAELHYHEEYYTQILPSRTDSGSRTEGAPYPEMSMATECGYPEPPSGVNATADVSSEQAYIQVKWNNITHPAIDSRCDNISGLRVDHKEKDNTEWSETDVNITDTEHTIEVAPNEIYEVQVVSINNQHFESHPNKVEVTVGKPVASGPDVALIASVTVVVVVLVVAAIIVVLYMLKIRRKKEPAGNNTSPNNKQRAQHTSVTATYENFNIAQSEPNTSNGFGDLGPIPLEELESFVKKKTADDNILDVEYQSLPADNLDRCRMGQTDDNKVKNRYKNIFPYDDTRVVLRTNGDDNTLDYINANYITGYVEEHEYIATQGPRTETIDDMWRMIWQENANRIVMVANISEGGKKRCAQYWPMGRPGSSSQFGDFYVTLESEETCANYTYRVLVVADKDSSRRIHHFHFTSWEDKNNPVYGSVTLFAFHRMVRSVDSISRGPMIVHCSAGVGRTGTFIAFDAVVNQGHHEGQVDIYKYVQKIRQERMSMVQTKEQYVFLHEALAENFKIGTTSSTLGELPNNTEIQRQFKVLMSFVDAKKKMRQDGDQPENLHKNRERAVVADDSHRPYLNTMYKDGTNYVNAVFVSSYKAHKQYIVTQMPLPDTIVDFWRLVHEQSCNTIVMLNDMDPRDPKCKDYWPSDAHPNQTYGPIEVELVDNDSNNSISSVKTRDFDVKLVSSKFRTENNTSRVRQFQLLRWPKDHDLPPSGSHLLNLMELVQSWQQQEGLRPPESHILVHCMNGAARSGLYCALAYTMNKMQSEQVVDPFLAVRAVSRSRPQFVNSMAQYKFLYDVASEHAINSSEYANCP